MSILVVILNCYTKKCDPNLDDIIKAFDDPLFKISTIKVNSDTDYFIEAFKFAENYDYYLFIKDDSICNKNISKKIKKALLTKADIYFLSSYQDACHLYQPVKNNKHLKYTLNCGATQAFLISSSIKNSLLEDLKITKKSLNKIIKNKIKNNKLKAVVFYPPIVSFDTMLATSNEDYKKSNLCMDVYDYDDENDDTVIIVWIIIIVAIIIILAGLVPYFKYY